MFKILFGSDFRITGLAPVSWWNNTFTGIFLFLVLVGVAGSVVSAFINAQAGHEGRSSKFVVFMTQIVWAPFKAFKRIFLLNK